MLTIGTVTNCREHRLGIAFEFDGTTETGTFVRHLQGLEKDYSLVGDVWRETFEYDVTPRPFYLDHAVVVICTGRFTEHHFWGVLL